MRPAAVKALQIDPQLADAHTAMGWVYAFENKWDNAENAFRQAIRLNPSLTQAYTAYSITTLQPLQRSDEALQLLDVALHYDPLSLDVLREIGDVQLNAGRYAEAVDAFQRIRVVEPDFPWLRTLLARALIFAGQAEEALPLWEPRAIWPVQFYLRMGKRVEAEKHAAETATIPYRVVMLAASLGDTNRALEALQQVVVREPHRIGYLLIQPEVAPLRTHPRVVALRKSLNLP
jgi:tetratricopeptide (TPR) repeat protein